MSLYSVKNKLYTTVNQMDNVQHCLEHDSHIIATADLLLYKF